MPLIICEIELDLPCSKNVWSEILITPRVAGNADVNTPVPEVAAIQTTGAKFQINNTKLYVLVVTLFVNDNTKFLENLKQGLKKKQFLRGNIDLK